MDVRRALSQRASLERRRLARYPSSAAGRRWMSVSVGYGVIGSTSDSGSLSLGSSPGTPARFGKSDRSPVEFLAAAVRCEAPLCSGLARRPLKAVARVRIPSGLPLVDRPSPATTRVGGDLVVSGRARLRAVIYGCSRPIGAEVLARWPESRDRPDLAPGTRQAGSAMVITRRSASIPMGQRRRRDVAAGNACRRRSGPHRQPRRAGATPVAHTVRHTVFRGNAVGTDLAP
jgi:hypothetical protein